MTAAGYSGTPLAKKLGIGAGHIVATLHAPDDLESLLAPLPAGVVLRTDLRARPDVVLHFCLERREFERRLPQLGRKVFPGGAIWIAWPKKASKVPTDMTEDVVREVALPTGLVDNKVCAIDATWSGLRLVWRKELRSGACPI